LIAEGSLSFEQVAKRVGVSAWALWSWRQRPEFCLLVKQRLEFYRAEALTHGIALREQRIRALNDRWQRMRRLIDARAKDMADVPGGDTGLLVRKVRGIGDGSNFRQVDWYEFDHALLRELRAIEEHVAHELGQWRPEPTETTGPREVDATAMSTAELLERARQILRAAGESPPEASADHVGDP
jgi:hypothetical protein